MRHQRADDDVHLARRLIGENVGGDETDRPSRRRHFLRRAGGQRVLIYAGKIEFESASDRPTVDLAHHVAESTANVDDGNGSIRGQAAGSCQMFEESQRRPVGEREVIHFGEVDETGAKCLEVRVSGIHQLRQVTAVGKINILHFSRRRVEQRGIGHGALRRRLPTARVAEERLELGAQSHVDFRHRHGQTEIGEACDAIAPI